MPDATIFSGRNKCLQIVSYGKGLNVSVWPPDIRLKLLDGRNLRKVRNSPNIFRVPYRCHSLCLWVGASLYSVIFGVILPM